jgi:hypothetical protein
MIQNEAMKEREVKDYQNPFNLKFLLNTSHELNVEETPQNKSKKQLPIYKVYLILM